MGRPRIQKNDLDNNAASLGMAMITEKYVHDTELRRENAFENRLNGHMQVYIGGRSNHKRHERQRPEVAPERLLETESFLPRRELRIYSADHFPRQTFACDCHESDIRICGSRLLCPAQCCLQEKVQTTRDTGSNDMNK